MSIRQKIFASFLVVILLLLISLGSVFAFHIFSLRDYKKISDILVLENALSYRVPNLIEAYSAFAFAPGSEERIDAYRKERDAIFDIFIQLDSAVADPDSRVAYQGLRNIIESIIVDLDTGQLALIQGDIVSSSKHFDNAVQKKGYLEASITDLILKQLQYLDRVQTDIQKAYQIQLTIVVLWTVFVVILVMAYSFIFSKKLTSSIVELFQSAEKVSRGDYHLQIPSHLLEEKDEVGSLAVSFDTMLKTLNTKIDQTESISAVAVEAKIHLEERNADLEKAQIVTANLLEDLEVEKNIVEKKVLERTEDLEREKAKLLQVTQNMKGSGILLDREHNVVFVNDEVYTLLNIKKSDSLSGILEALFKTFESNGVRAHFERCIKGETFQVPEAEVHTKIYELFFHCLHSTEKDSSEIAGYFILIFDITETKLLERSKSELVAVASHQLRTPLTAMRGNVEMLVDESYGPLNKEQHELLNDIDVSTIRLITMVNEMLDITKIEKGDLDMTLETFSAEEIINSVLSDLADYAQRHNFTSIYHKPDTTPYIYGDKVRVRQIFQNLIDNAIKYSRHPGTLDITCTVTPEKVEVIFKDNGIGVPTAEKTKLFGRFYRASNTSKTTSSGSGLGLYIVKSIARQLGGDINLESEEGVGSTFTVTLPSRESTNT